MTIIDRRFETVESTEFRNGMSRLGAAVNIVTTRAPEGPFGFTASAVCSVSDTPATLLACINRQSSCFPAFQAARFFCVNTLACGHEALSNLFGGKTPMPERFLSGRWLQGKTGAPVLEDALVSFECELAHAFDEGTHRVLFGRVVDIRRSDREAALLYCSRRYVVCGEAAPA
ncbi:flavin reductase [Neorhizobium petrolearium]|uniref:flavin reductase n=1 Tax=Neorhizobium petrolearium TaxID=515361 RepID=UPI003F5CF45D